MGFHFWFNTYYHLSTENLNPEQFQTFKEKMREVYEAAQPQWQPIETAPKGKDILLLTKQGDVATGYWGYEDRECTGQWMWFDGEPIQQDVVGWMPKEMLVREE